MTSVPNGNEPDARQQPAAAGALVDPKTGRPLPQSRQPGYYPGYSTLDQQSFWDEATREVVLNRVHNVPPIRFFSEEEARTMEAIADRLLPQDDREPAFRVPIVNYIDEKLYDDLIDGYRYEDMPPDREAFQLGIQVIDQIARHLHNAPFVQLGPHRQDEVLLTIHDGKPPAGEEIWKRMEIDRFWLLLLGDVVGAYYAHPYAWDEIGFGGPAYPRGYMRLENGKPEPWEVDEVRYEWQAPPESLSDVYKPVGGGRPHHPAPGQAGTH